MPGKYELIADLAKFFPVENASTVVGPGDDATVTDSDGNQTVTSSKVFIENVHFDLTYFPLRHLGYKLATVAFADVLAMNATPSQLLVNIAVSDRFDLRMVNEILSGVGACCETVHADLAGLDLTTRIGRLHHRDRGVRSRAAVHPQGRVRERTHLRLRRFRGSLHRSAAPRTREEGL